MEEETEMKESRKRKMSLSENEYDEAFPKAKMKRCDNFVADDNPINAQWQMNIEEVAEDINEMNRNAIVASDLPHISYIINKTFMKTLEKYKMQILKVIYTNKYSSEVEKNLSVITSLCKLQHIDLRRFIDSCYFPVDVRNVRISRKKEKLDFISNVYKLWKAAGFQTNLLSMFFDKGYFEYVLFPLYDMFDVNYLNMCNNLRDRNLEEEANMTQKKKYIHHTLSIMVYFCYIMDKKGKHNGSLLSFFNDAEVYKELSKAESKNFDAASNAFRDVFMLMKRFISLKMQILTANVLLLLNINFGFRKYLKFLIRVNYIENLNKYRKRFNTYLINVMENEQATVNLSMDQRRLKNLKKRYMRRLYPEEEEWNYLLQKKKKTV